MYSKWIWMVLSSRCLHSCVTGFSRSVQAGFFSSSLILRRDVRKVFRQWTAYPCADLHVFPVLSPLRKKTGFLNKATVTAVYDHCSDDGRVYIHGTETSSGSVTSKTTYRSPLELTDPEGNSLGRMDVDLSMSAVHSIGSLFAAIPVLRLTNASPAARLCVAMPKPTLLLLYHKHCIPHASNSS